MSKTYYVYILASQSKVLYTGVTGNLAGRVSQHQRKQLPGFTAKYNVNRLVYFEEYAQIQAAIAREKQIKGWLRAKKVALIEANNPEWQDLSADWFQEE
jgi:putative endonuclease